MAESYMAQARNTWLSKECVHTGDLYLHTYMGYINLMNAIAQNDVDDIIGRVNILKSRILERGDMNGNDKNAVTNALNDIGIAASNNTLWPLSSERTVGNLATIADTIKLNMYERVTECQCGSQMGHKQIGS